MVVLSSGRDTSYATFAIGATSTNSFSVTARNISGGAPLPNSNVTFNYIAVGRRA